MNSNPVYRLPQIGIVIALLAITCAGCSRSVKICPTAGQVFVNGKPAAGLYVVFQAIDDPKRERSPDTARTEADGSFSARVRGPGEYAITAFWPRVTQDQGETIEGEDYFNGKYRKAEQPALRTTILAGENTLPAIHLTFP